MTWRDHWTDDDLREELEHASTEFLLNLLRGNIGDVATNALYRRLRREFPTDSEKDLYSRFLDLPWETKDMIKELHNPDPKTRRELEDKALSQYIDNLDQGE